MQKKLIALTIGLISVASFSAAHANYTSSANSNPPPAPSSVVISSNMPHHHSQQNTAFSSQSSAAPTYQSHHHSQPFWVSMSTGEPIPTDAVSGGMQHHPNAMLYVCRANYHGGLHPGKYFRGNCNISWGGHEKVMQKYEVLVSKDELTWVNDNGKLPRHSIVGGYENQHKLYICQASYGNGTHPGKIVGRKCHFAWGGREIVASNYKVLTG